MTTAAGSVAADGLVAGPSRFAGTVEIPVVMPESSSGPQDELRNALYEVSGSLALTDDLTLQSGFNVDIGRVLERYAPSEDAFDNLFYSSAALGSPYVSLSNGGAYLGLNMKLADGVQFTFGHAASTPGLNRYLLTPHLALAALGGRLPYDARSTNSVVAGMTWDFAKWGGLGFSASQITEHGGVLGIANAGIGSARTTALGVAAHVGFGGGWVTTASYSEGSTQLDLRPGAFAPDASLRSESYGVAVAKHGLFSKNDALGVALARPAPNFGSTFTAENANDLQFFGRDKLLAGMAPETDIELGYKTEFFGDSVALQANASYQMNFGGQTGNNAVSLLSRAKIKF
jgi:hypothetical protein